MTTSEATTKKPLWLLMEERILQLDPQDLSGDKLESSIQRIAGELDNEGYNVSRHGGNLIKLRFAVDKARNAGKPLMKDFNAVVTAFSLEDVADPYAATNNIRSAFGSSQFRPGLA